MEKVKLDPKALEHLRKSSSGFVTSAHGHYLAEAAQYTRTTGDALEALRLLVAMWGSAYAARDEQKKALNDVGLWLERRLQENPHISADEMLTELEWLRRLARYAEAKADRERRHLQGRREDRAGRSRAPAGGRGAAPSVERRFGNLIERIRERRTPKPSPDDEKSKVESKATGAPVIPDRLPDYFEADLVDFENAREAWRAFKDRLKKGKEPKDRILTIQPVNALLRPLAQGLVCSTKSAGFKELFEDIERRAGTHRTFYVTDIEKAETTMLAKRILLTPPAGEDTPQP